MDWIHGPFVLFLTAPNHHRCSAPQLPDPESEWKEASQFSFRMSTGGFVQWLRRQFCLTTGVLDCSRFSWAYNSTHLARSWALCRLPSSLIIFCSVQMIYNAMTISNFLCSLAFRINSTAPSAIWIEANSTLSASMPSKRQRSFATRHLKNRWPPSSPRWLQTGHLVQIFMPRRAKLHLKGWLLCANRQRKCLILFGHLSFQIFFHGLPGLQLLPLAVQRCFCSSRNQLGQLCKHF